MSLVVIWQQTITFYKHTARGRWLKKLKMIAEFPFEAATFLFVVWKMAAILPRPQCVKSYDDESTRRFSANGCIVFK